MVTVDRFSKTALFVALTTYPTAQQTVDLLVKEIVKYYGPPTDLLSRPSIHCLVLEELLEATGSGC